MNDLHSLKLEFISIVKDSINRNGIDDLMAWLDTTDFYQAPSSARYHGAEPGGLVAHSIAVYKRLKALQTTESDETIAIVSLFHDLCKVNFYKPSYRNVKNEETGKWEKVPSYEFSDSLPLGHGEKSMFILSRYIKLTDDEALSVRWHMGGYYSSNPSESTTLANALLKVSLYFCFRLLTSKLHFGIVNK